MKIFTSLAFLFLFSFYINAQPRQELVEVMVSPNHSDWTYSPGEQAEFSISVYKNNVPLNGIEIEYTIQPDPGYRSLAIWDEGTRTLKNHSTKIKAKKFKEPGFLRCTAKVKVDGKEYSSYTTVGFAPDKIQPTTTLPKDFEVFWKKNREELNQVPMNPILTLMPERCTDKVDVYHVGLDNIKGKIYGILAKPKKAGKYPAILHVPGAGIRPYYGEVDEAAEGFISFTIGIHGIPVNLDQSVYNALGQGALNGYQTFNLFG